MEYPKANNCLTLVHQFYNNHRRQNGLDKRGQGKFLKGSFLASKMDSFLETGLGASLASHWTPQLFTVGLYVKVLQSESTI